LGLFDKLGGSMEERTIESIGRNLEAVLNTRQGYGAVVEVYGLGAYDAYLATKPLVETLTAEMTEMIRRFEPRLCDPVVRVLGRDKELWVRFSVTGTVGGKQQAYRVLFHSVFRNVRVETLG